MGEKQGLVPGAGTQKSEASGETATTEAEAAQNLRATTVELAVAISSNKIIDLRSLASL